MSLAKHWIFTLNNWVDADVERLKGLHPEHVDYITFGYETAPTTGTPHLQGYVVFKQRKRLAGARALIGEAHMEIKRGTVEQARDYAQKEGVFEEEGTLPAEAGHRGDVDAFKEWVLQYHAEHGCAPEEQSYSVEFPGLFLRYRANLKTLVEHLCPAPVLEEGVLRSWQADIWSIIHSAPDDRKVIFLVDPQGGSGKTWLQRYLLSHLPKRVQVLSSGKRDDVAHAIDESKDVFLFNIPRGGMEFLNYTVLEQIKDRMVFSPKYNSRMKLFVHANTHVFVFCNEAPDMNKMTRDRYHVVNLS